MTNEDKYQIIIDEVCKYYNVPVNEVCQKTRKRKCVEPRQVIYYFARKFTKLSYSDISNVFAQDHATAMHGERVIQGLIQFNGMGVHTVKIAGRIRFKFQSSDAQAFIKLAITMVKKMRLGLHYRAMRRKAVKFKKIYCVI